MTPQEAIEWLKFIEKKYIHGGDEDFDEKRKTAINTAIQVLEKLISKKPIENKYKGVQADYILLACPDCKQEFQFLEDITGNCNEQEQPFYCPDCGQKIDWSDTE